MDETGIILPLAGTILAATAIAATFVGAVFAMREARARKRAGQPELGEQARPQPTARPDAEADEVAAGPPRAPRRHLGQTGAAVLGAVGAFVGGAVGLFGSQRWLALGLLFLAAVLTGYLALPQRPVPSRWMPSGWVLLSVVGVGACALLLFNASLLYRTLSPTARLRVLQSGVEVQAQGDARFEPARREQSLKRGQVVRTNANGLAEITYKDAITRLGKHTTVQLTRLLSVGGHRTLAVRLESGQLWATSAGASAEDRYQLRTPHAVADVNGTFAAQCDATGVCNFLALTGATTVSSNAGDQAVTLNRGRSLVVRADGAPGGVTLLSPDQIAGNPWVKFNRTIDPAPPDEDDPSEATIAGKWKTRMTLTTTTGPSGLYRGDTWLRSYDITLACDRSPCELRFDGSKLEFDGTTYRTAFPAESSPCEGKPGEARQRFELTVAKAGRQEDGLRATELKGTLKYSFVPGRGSSCKPWSYQAELAAPPGTTLPVDYPNHEEEALMNLLGFPERTCHRDAALPEGATAGVKCTPPTGASSVSVLKFRDRAALYAYYDDRVRNSGVPSDYGGCDEPPDVGTGESTYTVGDRTEGRFVCYRDKSGHRWIISTADRAKALVVIVRNDGKWDPLYSFWSESIFT